MSRWPRAQFKTIGLEGVGHHLIESLPLEVTGVARAGGQRSFPSLRTWAEGSFDGDPSKDEFLRDKKFLVLVRDPVDSWSSALARFWDPNSWDLR